MSGWDNIGNNDTSDKKKLTFMKLSKGMHAIRIISPEPVSRWTHWIQQANAGKGMTIPCIGNNCPACAENKPLKAAKKPVKYNSSKKHAINVINRATKQIEIIDKGNTLFESIVSAWMGAKAMNNNQDIKITDFDIQLIVSGTDDKPSYNAIPMPMIPLTDADKALEPFDLVEMTKPLEPEHVAMLMQGKTFADIFGSTDVAESTTSSDELPDIKF